MNVGIGVIRNAVGHATSTVRPALLVIAKAPVPGKVKTRLCPPCTPEQAADLARAALRDTLAAALAAQHAGRRVVVLDGPPGPWLPEGFEVIAQHGDGLAERLGAAFARRRRARVPGRHGHAAGHARAARRRSHRVDATDDSAFGTTPDGGYWGIGLRTPDPRVFEHVPMSTDHTGARQLARLTELGLNPAILPPLTDVDTFDDALARRRRGARDALRRRASRSSRRWPRDRHRTSLQRADRPRRPARAAARRRALRAPAGLRRPAPRRHRPGAGRRGSGSPTGALEPFPVDRWLAPADAVDHGDPAKTSTAPVLDLGCGPGRHLAALRKLGKEGLGVDLSEIAVALARGRGALVINGSLWEDVPGAGTWRTILLLDGNIGIGGAPVALLKRAGELLDAGRRDRRRDRPAGRADAPRAGAHRGAGDGLGVVSVGAGRGR